MSGRYRQMQPILSGTPGHHEHQECHLVLDPVIDWKPVELLLVLDGQVHGKGHVSFLFRFLCEFALLLLVACFSLFSAGCCVRLPVYSAIDCQEKLAAEATYYVSCGTLNSFLAPPNPHSLGRERLFTTLNTAEAGGGGLWAVMTTVDC